MIDYLKIQDVLDIKYLNKNYYRHFGEFINSIIYIKKFSIIKDSEENLDDDIIENKLNIYLIINAFDEDMNEYSIKTKSKVLINQFKNLLDALKDKQTIAKIQLIKNRIIVKCIKQYIAAKCEKIDLKNKNNKNSFYYKISQV